VEATLSVVVVGLMLVAALRTISASAQGQIHNADRLRGALLANALLTEITGLRYSEPTEVALFGPEVSELGGRPAYDDVDDYHGWTESPPVEKDGAAIPNAAGWRRSVTVAYTNPANLSATSAIATGAKRITVTVEHNGVPVAVMTAVRTSAR
jgi:hypothetical protein